LSAWPAVDPLLDREEVNLDTSTSRHYARIVWSRGADLRGFQSPGTTCLLSAVITVSFPGVIQNNADIGDECRVTSSMGNQEDEQVVGHVMASKHTSSTLNEDLNPMMK
nr:hypothetical protein [Tanacetum cinerariifolium]